MDIFTAFSASDIGFAIGGLFVAALVKGAAGMGFSTTALPLLVLALGVETAMPLVLIPSLSSNVFVMIQSREFTAMVRRFWFMMVCIVPGVVAGLWCLAVVDRAIAAAVLGLVLIVYGLYALSSPVIQLPPRLEKPLQGPVGLANGFVNGLTGSQIFPATPFLLMLDLKPNQFTQTNNITFTLATVIMMAGLTQIGFMTLAILLLSIAGIVPVYIGVYLGGLFRDRLDIETFRKMVLAVLMALGAVLIAKWMV